MKKLFTLSILILLLNSLQVNTSNAQLTGTLTIPGTYASISAAISSLNALGVGAGGVTFNVAAGYVETMTQSLGSYTINITTNPPNASNPVVFQKSGAGANPLVQSNSLGTGTVTVSSFGANGDAFFKLNGTDYITFDGIDLLEGYTGTSTTQKMEYGFMLCRASSTDGCKNVTIKNCTMTFYLTAATAVSAGVYASNYSSGGSLFSTTSIAGRHENIFIDGCTIYNTITGMYFNGTVDASAPYNLYDNNIQVGVTTPNTMICGTRTTANTNTCYGIYSIYSDSVKFNNNTIRVNVGTNVTSTHYGIFTSTGNNSFVDIIGNNISDTSNASSSSQQSGIVNTFGTSGTNNTVNIQNNTISNCRYSPASLPTVTYIQNLAGALTINISGNTISNNTVGNGTTTPTGTVTGILQSTANATAGAVLNINNNNVNNLSRSQLSASTGQTIGIQVSACSYTTNVYNNNVNTIPLNTTLSTLAGIYISATAGSTLNAYNNTIFGITRTAGVTSGPTYGLYASQSSPTTNVYGNTIYNVSNSVAASTGALYGYYNFGVGTVAENFYNNTIYSLTNSGSGLTYGAYVASGSAGLSKQIYGNQIYNITDGTGQLTGLYINYISTGNFYKNRIYNITTNNTASSPGVFGIQIQSSGTTPTYDIYNNLIHEIKAPLSTVTLGVIGLYIIGGTTANVFYNTIYLDATSSGTNFGATALYASTIPTLDLRNNILINKSSPNGTGLVIAFYRSSSTLTTYSSNSNNNNFYAGTPASNKLIYYDVTNSDQTLSAFQTRVSPRDNASVTENTSFVNTSVSPYDLHISSCSTVQVESGGTIVSTY